MSLKYTLYIHIPFCSHRCAYCDFNTYVGHEHSLPAYVEALCREIVFLGQSVPERIRLRSVFFGGGTPSLLSPEQFDTILGSVHDTYTLEDPEITIEANPGTVSLSALRVLYGLGINRISFGMQSAIPGELRMLERQHDYFDVINAVTWARQAGFNDINLDLIYGLPLQTLADWSATVQLVLGLAPAHLSLYALTLEGGTPFGHWAAKGLMPIPDPDTAAEMYDWAGSTLVAAGFQQYEISNWARPGHQCRHNLQYWRGLPYLAVGAGAHGYANGNRYSNVLRIKTYLERMRPPLTDLPFPFTPATVNRHRQSLRDETGEFMINGLRLTEEGISPSTFRDRFGQDLEQVFNEQIIELIRLGLLERGTNHLRLTKRGRLLGNQVFMRFV